MTKVTHLTPEQRGQRVDSREPDEESATPDTTVGQFLRSARLARGDDVATVSRALRIRRDHLQAIEDERLEALPGRTYAVGFVRSYAQYLGLDASACVERFKRETAGRSDGALQIGPPPPDLGASRMPSGWTVMAVLVVGIVLYGGWHLARSADVFSSQSVAPVPARLAAPAPAAKLQISHAASRPTPAASISTLPGASKAAAMGVAPAGPTRLVAAAANGASVKRAPALPLTAGPPVDGPPGQVYGAKNNDSRVILHVRSLTHVLVEGPDGRVYINRILHPGDTYRVPDHVGLSLTAQDGSAVSVELDGQEMGAAGAAGQMADALSLDPQAIVDRAHGGNPG